MRILHVASYYLAGSFYKHLFQRQIHRGLPIDVYVPADMKSKAGDFDHGSYTTILRNHHKSERFLYFTKVKKFVKSLQAHYPLENIDILHGHSLFTNGYACEQIKKNHGIPYLVAVRGGDLGFFFPYAPHLRRIGKRILRHADRVVFISASAEEKLLRKYLTAAEGEALRKKSCCIPNGLDEFWFSHKEKTARKKPQADIRCLFVGRLNQQKNLYRSIRAIEQLRKDGLPLTLTAIGQLSNPFLAHKIRRSKWVTHYPHMPKEKLLEHYRASDLFIMNSIRETFGLVYLEAMSQGLPLVYSRGEGFAGYFEEGQVGYGADSRDVRSIAQAIRNVLRHYEAISDRCLKELELFRWDKIEQQYYEIYQEILHEKV